MPLFRKKPVVIEAVQFTGSNCQEILTFIGVTRKATTFEVNGKITGVVIETLEGDHRANIGDYIIKGIKGECYPCKPDIFAKTYEQVN